MVLPATEANICIPSPRYFNARPKNIKPGDARRSIIPVIISIGPSIARPYSSPSTTGILLPATSANICIPSAKDINARPNMIYPGDARRSIIPVIIRIGPSIARPRSSPSTTGILLPATEANICIPSAKDINAIPKNIKPGIAIRSIRLVIISIGPSIARPNSSPSTTGMLLPATEANICIPSPREINARPNNIKPGAAIRSIRLVIISIGPRIARPRSSPSTTGILLPATEANICIPSPRDINAKPNMRYPGAAIRSIRLVIINKPDIKANPNSSFIV